MVSGHGYQPAESIVQQITADRVGYLTDCMVKFTQREKMARGEEVFNEGDVGILW